MPNYSGMWTLQAQMQAVSQGTWTGFPYLYSWGINDNGQLGQNDRVYRSSPTQVGADTNWSSLSIAPEGGTFVLAVKTDGTLWSWGENHVGQLGQNNTTSRSSPVQIGALTTWSVVSCSNTSGMAIKTDGTLWTWGYNNYGQLGQNTASTISVSSPVQVGALTNWAKLTGGNFAVVAIKTDGTLWSWGQNTYGQLGQNIAYTVSRSSPVQVGALTNWANVSGEGFHILATKTDGTLWAWGANQQGQLGQNNVTYRSSPVQIGALTTWSKVGGGSNFSTAIKTDGTLWSWGANTQGQLGINNTAARSSPVQIGSDTNWSKTKPGQTFSVALKTNGTLWSWGQNSNGQQGQNDRVVRSSPVQVGADTTWIDIYAGTSVAMAIKS